MGDRVSSDHPTVETIRATLESSATGSHVTVPAADVLPTDEVVRVVIEETERFARPERPLQGDGCTLPGVYETPDQARDGGPSGNLLPDWLDDAGIAAGNSVLLDVVEEGFLYGLRAPGETTVYEAREPPAESLQSIAETLEE